MKYIISINLLILTTGILFISCSSTKNIAFDIKNHYLPVSQDLYDTIIRMDSIVFDAANKGEIDKMKTLFTQDLEFYHDAGGD